MALALWSGDLWLLLEGEVPIWEMRDARVAIMLALLAGYAPVARRYANLAALSNLEALRPFVTADPAGNATLRRCLEPLDRAEARRAGLMLLPLMPLVALAVDRDPSLYFQAWYWRTTQVVTWVLGFWLCWHLGHLGYATREHARRFSTLVPFLRDDDLLERRAVSPFARQGLRSALLGLVAIAILTLNGVDRDFGPAVVGLLALGLIGSAYALLLPTRALHARLRAAKRNEVARVAAAVRGEPGALADSAIAARASTATLSDLLAYRSWVEARGEWPFDTPSLLRYALYAAIPLGSWLGGALVERGLGMVID